MIIDVLSISKFRDGARPGDDVPVVAPGVLFGVFDGATDPRGTIVDGHGAGRLAALAVSQAALRLASDPANRLLPGDQILGRLSQELNARTATLDLPIPPSSTIAFAMDCGDRWRFMALGDTGIRLNGSELFQREKIIDSISTGARVAVFKEIASRSTTDDMDAVEATTRRSILLGLDRAVAENILTEACAAEIIRETIETLGLQAHAAQITDFLRGGIQVQHTYSNQSEQHLGFDTMNGSQPTRGELIDFMRPKSEVHSIEIFSDGYPNHPDEATAAAWEAAFHRAEETDFHKIGRFATVKGSTRQEFFDDRSVVIVSGM